MHAVGVMCVMLLGHERIRLGDQVQADRKIAAEAMGFVLLPAEADHEQSIFAHLRAGLWKYVFREMWLGSMCCPRSACTLQSDQAASSITLSAVPRHAFAHTCVHRDVGEALPIHIPQQSDCFLYRNLVRGRDA